MRKGEPLIYGGASPPMDWLASLLFCARALAVTCLGTSSRAPARETAGDDESDGKAKKHYAVQLALYVDILERLGRSAGRSAFVWDVHGKEVAYDLEAPLGPRAP
jgi:hypothetical protein